MRRSEEHQSLADRRGYLLLIGLSFAGFVSIGLPDGLLGVAWPSMRRDLGVPLDALGSYLVSLVAGYLTASVTSERVVRQIGVGMVLALSCLLTAGSLFGIALAPVWLVVLVCGVVAGLGAGAIDAGLNAFAATNFSPRIVNWMHASFSIGAAGSPAFMGLVLDAGYVWRWGYGAVGVVQAVLGLAFLVTVDRWATPGAAATGGDIPRGGAKPRRQRATLLLTGAVFFFYTGAEVSAGGWAYSLLVEARGMNSGPASLAVSLFWGALGIGRVIFGVVADRLAPVALVRSCGVAMIAGAGLVWPDANAPSTLLGFGLIGFAAAPIFPTLISATPARFGAVGSAEAVGIQVGGAALGAATLPAIAGVIAARTTLEIVPPFVALCCLVMLATHEWLLRRTTPAAPTRDLVGS